MGITCARIGWPVERSPFAIIRISRARRPRARTVLRNLFECDSIQGKALLLQHKPSSRPSFLRRLALWRGRTVEKANLRYRARTAILDSGTSSQPAPSRAYNGMLRVISTGLTLVNSR